MLWSFMHCSPAPLGSYSSSMLGAWAIGTFGIRIGTSVEKSNNFFKFSILFPSIIPPSHVMETRT